MAVPLPHKSPGREPGDCEREGHPACHPAPDQRHGSAWLVQSVCHVAVPQLALGAYMPHTPRRTGLRSSSALASKAGGIARATTHR